MTHSPPAPESYAPHQPDPVVSQFTVRAEESGERLDLFLAKHLAVSRGRAHSYVAFATVNDQPGKASQKLKEDEVVTVGVPVAEEQTAPITAAGLAALLPPILYEDDYLIILNKPRGLVVHPGAGNETNTLVDVLRAAGRTLSTVGPPERGGIVHRLDKDTTGLICVCKTDEAHWKVADAFATRHVRKNYLALVCGVPPLRGRVEAPIARHPGQRKKMAVIREGRPAVTEYTVVRSWPKFALIDVDLLTGRTHQIRVHLAYVHHPVMNDELYGGCKRAFDSAPSEDARLAMKGLAGQALHAARLAFVHPISDEPLAFEAPLPSDFQCVIDALDAAPTS